MQYQELSPLAHAMVKALLLESLSLERAIEQLCRQRGISMKSGLLESTDELLANLAQRGALQGGYALDELTTDEATF